MIDTVTYFTYKLFFMFIYIYLFVSCRRRLSYTKRVDLNVSTNLHTNEYFPLDRKKFHLTFYPKTKI